MQTHHIEPCPAAGVEENVLASHATTPGKSSEGEESFPKEGDDSAPSFESHSLSSVSRANMDLRLFLSGFPC